MNQQVQRTVRFVPLILYGLGLLLTALFLGAVDAVATTALVTAPFAFGAPLVTVFIGRRPRRRRAYVLGAVLGLLGVASVLAVAAFTSLFWVSLGLSGNGDTDVTFLQALPMLGGVFMEALGNMWMLLCGPLAAAVWMTICAVMCQAETRPCP